MFKSPLVRLLPLFACAAVTAQANPEAVRIPNEMRNDPAVIAMIAEYEAIVGNPKLAPICDVKKNFGLYTVKIDGVRQARYYVEGQGVGCLPARLRPASPWKVTRWGQRWQDSDHEQWRQFVAALGMAIEKGKCATVDSCMISSANILRDETDKQAFHYSDCADFPYYLRTYFSYRKGLPFSLASYIRPRELNEDDQRKVEETNEKVEVYFGRIKEMNKGQLAPYVIKTPPPGNTNTLTVAPEIPGFTLAEVQELKTLVKTQERNRDPRYARSGNWVAGRTWVTDRTKYDFYRNWVSRLRDSASTATLRIWRNEGATYFDRNGKEYREEEPDFYSPVLDARGIVPGTVIYKTDGHTAIVYRIDTENGNIHYIDAHPDNTISKGVVDETWIKGMTGDSSLGGGFKNFRPIDYRKTWWSSEVTAQMAVDEQMGYFNSTEQFDKFPDAKTTTRYRENGLNVQVGYLDFLRLRMSQGRFRLHPVEQFTADVGRLCNNIQTRRDAVEEATDRNFHLNPHPVELPGNIYGADGEWEKYSTPGRDVVFKQRVASLIETLEKYKSMIQSRNPIIADASSLPELKTKLLNAWNSAATACMVGYRASNGTERTFNLLEALRRVPYMDYDPYLCPERRFGATDPAELASCTDTPDKANWSRYQQFLRNHLEKTPTAPMGWSLDELKAMPNNAVDANLLKVLDVAAAIKAL